MATIKLGSFRLRVEALGRHLRSRWQSFASARWLFDNQGDKIERDPEIQQELEEKAW